MAKQPKIISRGDAKAKGLKRYFTGKPCKHGHVCERFVSAGCVECSRLRAQSPKGREIMRQYDASPRGRERHWQYKQSPKGRDRAWCRHHSPKGREAAWRAHHSPKGRDRTWRHNNSLKGHEAQRRYRNSEKGRESQRRQQRRRRLERAEATYRERPTEANHTRLMNLIARRIRDDRD